ncbi:hypothetical protein [Devosia sp.]|uniref:hypothetical protein n=1 Tax=Devosia sp. TaxID=1871048 RepID=UPI002AFF3A7E|nr:hypothetical protein [Devosia sp.]
MNLPLAAMLAFQAIVFAVWIVIAFRWLFAMRADAVAESGRTLPGLGPTLRAFREGFTGARYARQRLWLGVSTVLLLAVSYLTSLMT